ncbi:MAG: response regulator [Bdellovibrionales bacterium]
MPTIDPNTKLRILVAEDNPAVQEFIVRALAAFEADVKTANDGQEALDALAANAFHVLITDIVMPNVDGIALALKVGQDYPSLRVIMISGYAQERMRAHNLESLVHRVIAKPFSLDEICDAVEDVLSIENDNQ